MRLVQTGPGFVPGNRPAAAGSIERDLRRCFHLQRLAINPDVACVPSFAEEQTREVLRFDVVGRATIAALCVHFGALVVLFQPLERNPIAAIVAGGVGQEPDVVGRTLTFVAVLLEERVEPLTNQRARAMSGVFGYHPESGSALRAEIVGIAGGRKPFFLELGAGAERRLQLARIV